MGGRKNQEWEALDEAERKPAAIGELKRLSDGTLGVSINIWNNQRSSAFPTAVVIKRLFGGWAAANRAAGLAPRRAGGPRRKFDDEKSARAIQETDKRHVLDEVKRPLVVKASDKGQPYSYYCWSRRCRVTTMVYGGGHFGHAAAV